MKRVGIVGGTDWRFLGGQFTAINEMVHDRTHGNHSAAITLWSPDLAAFEELEPGDARHARQIVEEGVHALLNAGADFVTLTSESMMSYGLDPDDANASKVMHVVDGAAAAVLSAQYAQVGLLGSGFAMGQPFLRDRLSARSDARVVVPNTRDRMALQWTIDEVRLGHITADAKDTLARITDQLAEDGTDAVVISAPELAKLWDDEHAKLPLIDMHAFNLRAIVDRMVDD